MCELATTGEPSAMSAIGTRVAVGQELAHVGAAAQALIAAAALRRARHADAIADLDASDLRTDGFDDADAAMTLNDGAWCCRQRRRVRHPAADHLPGRRRRVRPLVERQHGRLLQRRDRLAAWPELRHRRPVRRLHPAGEQEVAPRAQRSRWSSRDSSLQCVRQSGVRRWGEASAPAASCVRLRRRASPSHGSGVRSRRPGPGQTPPYPERRSRRLPAAAAAPCCSSRRREILRLLSVMGRMTRRGGGSRFSVLGSRFSVLGSRFSVLGSRFSVLGSWSAFQVRCSEC